MPSTKPRLPVAALRSRDPGFTKKMGNETTYTAKGRPKRAGEGDALRTPHAIACLASDTPVARSACPCEWGDQKTNPHGAAP